MRFASALPPWIVALLVLAALTLAWLAYVRTIVPLSRPRRLLLSALRAAVLLLLIASVLRPVRVQPSAADRDAVVPILVDTSQSMRLEDADGRSRISAARDVTARLTSGLAARFAAEVWTFGESLKRAKDVPPAAEERRSDLAQALRALRERYRDRRVPAIVVISDGGETGAESAASTVEDGVAPIYTVGVGSAAGGADLELLDVSAGEARLADSSVDITASAVNRGSGVPFDLRLLENGRPIDLQRVTPAAAGSPVSVVFTVSPPPDSAALYTVEIPAASVELVFENNRRQVLVEPSGRRRRLLLVEGAPGFEHSFLKRALAADHGVEVDSVVRKGRDGEGAATYFIQAAANRGPQLTSGFPLDKRTLYAYDAVIFANLESDALSRAQLEMAGTFVSERGGGLLALGARSFGGQGLIGTPVEDVLPLSLSDRGSGVVRAAARSGAKYTVSVTADGQRHPVMRIGTTADETARRWTSVPALAGAALLGAPRPGAEVLALVEADDGARPLVAVQRFGEGRSMVFAGEASWRWRMQRPASDRTYELFWRQTMRWLSSAAPDPVSIPAVTGLMPGESRVVTVDVKDAEFRVVRAATVTTRVVLPDGEERELRVAASDPQSGRYSGEFRFDLPGVYRINASAREDGNELGVAERRVLVGAADLELADPRLNEEVLRRVSRASGGEYLAAADAARLPGLLADAAATPAAPVVEDLWQTPWVFATVVSLAAAEWVLRRRWGLK